MALSTLQKSTLQKWRLRRTSLFPGGLGALLACLGASAAPATPPAPTTSPDIAVSIVCGAADAACQSAAADMARAADGDALRVLTLIGRSDAQNIADIAGLSGVDLGLVRTDRQPSDAVGLRYVARLADQEIHIVATRNIVDIGQLAGRKVALGPAGSPARFTAETMLRRLGLSVDAQPDDIPHALDRLKSGEIAAVVALDGKPSRDIAAFVDPAHRFHLVPLPYDARADDLYLPATLTADEYPELVRSGETVDTLSVGAILATKNLSKDDPRYPRVARFVDALFSGLPNLAREQHPKWRDVNLAAAADGWTRFAAAQDWLDGKRGDALTRNPVAQPQRAAYAPAQTPVTMPAPGAPQKSAQAPSDELERFKQFVQKKRGKTGAKLAEDDTVKMFRDYQQWSGRR